MLPILDKETNKLRAVKFLKGFDFSELLVKIEIKFRFVVQLRKLFLHFNRDIETIHSFPGRL